MYAIIHKYICMLVIVFVWQILIPLLYLVLVFLIVFFCCSCFSLHYTYGTNVWHMNEYTAYGVWFRLWHCYWHRSYATRSASQQLRETRNKYHILANWISRNLSIYSLKSKLEYTGNTKGWTYFNMRLQCRRDFIYCSALL